MKGNKKILALALLLLLVVASFGTYAIYKSSATSSDTVKAAAWVIKANGTDIVANNTFSIGNITWDATRYGQNNTIAPGDHGTVDIVIDASGSEVGVSYAVDISSVNTGNPNFTVAAASGSSLTGTIAYGSTMQATVTLDVTWTGVDDATPTTGANAKDIATAGTTVNIPVTVTVTQNPNPAA
jgi:hypothetical protein